MYCCQCGTELPPHADSCQKCGGAVLATSSTEPCDNPVIGRKRITWFWIVAVLLLCVCFVLIRAANRGRAEADTIIKHSQNETGESGPNTTTDFDTAPFDAKATKLPPHYIGHDPSKVFDVLMEREVQSRKGEFETTADYRKRVSELALSPIGVGAMTEASTFAFPVMILHTEYDADAQILAVYVGVDRTISFSSSLRKRDNIQAVQSTGKAFRKSSYAGQNAFGAQTDVVTTGGSYHFLLFPKSERFRTEGEFWWAKDFVFRLHAPASQAKELKERLQVIAVCRLQSPFTEIESETNKPTLQNPVEETNYRSYLSVSVSEFWLYDPETGKVLEKLRPDGRPPS